MNQLHMSKTISVAIDCPPEKVYSFVSNAENFPRWVTSFVRSAKKTDDGWILETTDGPLGIEFAAANEYGVLDHVVRPARDVEVTVPMRVVRNGAGSEVLFTLFQLPGMSDERFAEDAGMVERDLALLKHILESA